MRLSSIVSAALCAAALVLPSRAQAQLEGSNLHLTFEAPISGSVYQDYGTATIGAGTEWAGTYFGYYDVDVAARQLTLTFDLGGSISWCNCSFAGWHLSDVGNSAPAFSVSNIVGAPAPAVTWDADNVWINMANLNQSGNAVVTMDLTPEVVATPEPASLALLATGLAGIGLVRRRRAR